MKKAAHRGNHLLLQQHVDVVIHQGAVTARVFAQFNKHFGKADKVPLRDAVLKEAAFYTQRLSQLNPMALRRPVKTRCKSSVRIPEGPPEPAESGFG